MNLKVECKVNRQIKSGETKVRLKLRLITVNTCGGPNCIKICFSKLSGRLFWLMFKLTCLFNRDILTPQYSQVSSFNDLVLGQ